MGFEEFIAEWRGENDSIVVRTSGSTGKPKQIRLAKDFVRAGAMRTVRFFGLGAGDRLHSCVSADYIGGKMMAVRALECGAGLTWETPSNRPLEGLGPDETVDLLAVVPSQMLHIVSSLDTMPRLRNIIIGGSAIVPGLRRSIRESGLNAFETYGMTETASHIALRRIEDSERPFVPLEGITVGTDRRGCLEIKFESGERVVTNDIAEVYGDGSFSIKGRADHVIVTGGKKVHPEEVERKIAAVVSHPFVIGGEPDAKWGTRVVLRVESAGEEDMQGMLNSLRPLLEPWERPKRIEVVEKLARTSNGKLKRD